MVYGPVRPVGSVVRNGKTYVPSGTYQGPVQKGENVEKFRRTGRSSSSGGGGSSGSGGSSSSNARNAAAAKAAAEAEQVRKQLEAEEKIKQAEKARLIQKENLLRSLGARIIRKSSTDPRTGNRLSIIETRKGSEMVRQVRNLNTGNVTMNSYNVGMSGVPIRKTGGISTTTQSTPTKNISNFQKIISPKPSNIDSLLRRQSVNPNSSNIKKINLSTPKQAFVSSLKVAKLLTISAREIPRVLGDYGVSLGKGFTKIGLYATDEAGYITQTRLNKTTGKLYIPQGTKAISDKMGRVKKWANYDFKTNPLRDPDYQNVAITAGFVLVGAGSATAAKVLFGAVKGKAVYDAVKNPTTYNIAVAESLILPGLIARGVKVTNRLSPKYVKSTNGKFVLRKAPAEVFSRKGKTTLLKSRVKAPSFKRPFTSAADFLKGRKTGQFKKFTKDPGLILKEQTTASGAKSLSQQAKLEGKAVTAVNAAADQLTSWIKRKKIIRKPIPNEANFPIKIKNILAKFDSGRKLTNREFAEVNLWLQQNVAPNITLLERSLYADPEGGLRISRLGITKDREATLRDLFKGNFKFNANRPQVLIFENAKVARFPKSLTTIKNKLLRGSQLTTTETNQLIRWQTKTGSGKFKPIGSTIYSGGKEFEVTLAPGEFIKRIKKVGHTNIDGKKVTFVTAEIYKPSKLIAKNIKLANEGKLSTKQLNILENKLSRELGRKIRIETPETLKSQRRYSNDTPVLRVNARGLYIPSRRILINKRISNVRVPGNRATPRRTTNRPRRNVVNSPTLKRNSKNTPRRPIRNVRGKKTPVIKRPIRNIRAPNIINKPKVPLLTMSKRFTQKSLSKAQPVYFIVEKIRGKFKKLYPKALTKKHAEDFAVYSIDNKLSKTSFLIPMGTARRVAQPPKNIMGYANKNSFKVRKYRIKYGSRKLMVNGFIEKRRYFNDMIGERVAARNLRRNTTIRRKITPTQRKVMLRNLALARAKRGVKNTPPTAKRLIRTPPMRRKTTIKRQITPQQRRLLLLRLKKARAVRMANLRR